jgi:Asp-tRNA(Asn)/Glu-tRNA(Gln) amidotransferase A subunit family amidase
MKPYHHWPSLKAIAAEVKSGVRSAHSQVELALTLANNEALDSDISPTFISLHADIALALANELDAKIARGEDCGDLCGIPFAVKDNIDWRTLNTSAGSPKAYLKKALSTAPVLQGLIDRGAIPIGKTNMNEWAVGLTGENAHFGNVQNPHLGGCLSGGSSSGSARAVAMGIVPMALGSDTGGSIRMPAAWCGIVGLRPSSESFSLDGVVPRSRTLDVVGPIVNSIEDCHYFLGNSFLPKSTPTSIADGKATSIKIGWDPRLLNEVDAGVRKAFMQFMENAKQHYSVEFVEQSWPNFENATTCALTVLQMEFHEDFRHLCGPIEAYADLLGKPVINELRHSASLVPKDLTNAYAQLEEFRQAMLEIISSVDMLVLPLTPCGPVLEYGLPEAAKPLRELSLPMGASGLPILGMPLLSKKDPLGIAAASLAGVQLVGKKYQEHKLLNMVKLYLDAPN